MQVVENMLMKEEGRFVAFSSLLSFLRFLGFCVFVRETFTWILILCVYIHKEKCRSWRWIFH
jgi:uncharacterized membrane protein